MDVLDIFEKYGPWAVGLIAAILYAARDWRTISRLETRVEALERDYKDALSGLLMRATIALEKQQNR